MTTWQSMKGDGGGRERAIILYNNTIKAWKWTHTQERRSKLGSRKSFGSILGSRRVGNRWTNSWTGLWFTNRKKSCHLFKNFDESRKFTTMLQNKFSSPLTSFLCEPFFSRSLLVEPAPNFHEHRFVHVIQSQQAVGLEVPDFPLARTL